MRLFRIVALLGIVCVPLSTMAPPKRPEIYSVALVRLRVGNLEVSRPFYANALGLPQGTQGCFTPQGTAVCFFISPTQQVELVSGPASGGGLEALGLRVSDAATMRKYLVARGMKCGEVAKSNSGDDVVEVRDPENHRILLLSHKGGIAGSSTPALLSTIAPPKTTSTKTFSASTSTGTAEGKTTKPVGWTCRFPMAQTGSNTCSTFPPTRTITHSAS